MTKSSAGVGLSLISCTYNCEQALSGVLDFFSYLEGEWVPLDAIYSDASGLLAAKKRIQIIPLGFVVNAIIIIMDIYTNYMKNREYGKEAP